MATPWGVEFNEDVPVVVYDNVFIVVGNNNLNGTVLGLGNRLGLDAGLNLAVNKILNEFSNILFGDFLGLIKGKLLVLNGFLDSKSWEFFGVQIEVASVSAKGLGVNGGKVNLTLELDCQRLEGLSQLGTLLRGLGEYISERDLGLICLCQHGCSFGWVAKTYGHVAGISFWANFANKRNGGSLSE